MSFGFLLTYKQTLIHPASPIGSVCMYRPDPAHSPCSSSDAAPFPHQSTVPPAASNWFAPLKPDCFWPCRRRHIWLFTSSLPFRLIFRSSCLPSLIRSATNAAWQSFAVLALPASAVTHWQVRQHADGDDGRSPALTASSCVLSVQS